LTGENNPEPRTQYPEVRPWMPSLAALIVLAIGFRLPALFLIRYGGSAPDWSDFLYYHELAGLAAQGFFPDIHFWVEYPPLFPWLAVGIYRLSLTLPGWTQPFFWFDLILTAALAVADAGSVVAIDRLGDTYWGKGAGRRCATIYAAMFVPTFALLGWFDTLPTLFLLLALAWLCSTRMNAAPTPGRSALAGFAIGVGTMLKLFPLLALPAALVLHTPARAKVVSVIAAFLTIVLIALPFYVAGHDTFLATFRNVLARGSWMSPWAILDGYYGTGTVASLPDRLYFNVSALWGQPTRLPGLWWAAVLVGGVAYVWRGRAAWRVGTPRAAIALTGFSVALVLLLSRGFSQQFTVWLLPFVALILPDLTGAILAVLLALVDLVLEGYLYVALFPTLHSLLWLSAGARTLLLLWFAVESGLAIDPKLAERVRRVRRRVRAPAIAAIVAGAVASLVLVGPGLGAATVQRNGSGPIRDALGSVGASAAVVFTQPAVYDRLYPDIRPRPAVLVAEPKLLTWTGDRSLDQHLEAGLAGQDAVLVVTDTTQPASPLLPAVRDWLGARYGADPDRAVGSLVLTTWRAALRPAEKLVGARFGPSIELIGYSPDRLEGHAGAPLTVTFHWRAAAGAGADYTVSTQLLDRQGKLVVQHDAMPVDNTLPTSTWRPGQSVLDPVTLALPGGLASADYALIVVVYDHRTLKRLDAQGPGAAGDHAELGTVAVK